MTKTKEFGTQNWRPPRLQPPRNLVDQYTAQREAEEEIQRHYLASFVSGCLTGALGMFTFVVVAATVIYD